MTLCSPPASKAAWKNSTWAAVTAYWHANLAAEAVALPSLQYLHPAFLPLSRGTHPLWETCSSSSSAVRAATVQARMLSGRYQTDWLCHWNGLSGACCLPSCPAPRGDLEHLLTGACPALSPTMATTLTKCLDILSHHPLLLPPVHSCHLPVFSGKFFVFKLFIMTSGDCSSAGLRRWWQTGLHQ